MSFYEQRGKEIAGLLQERDVWKARSASLFQEILDKLGTCGGRAATKLAMDNHGELYEAAKPHILFLLAEHEGKPTLEMGCPEPNEPTSEQGDEIYAVYRNMVGVNEQVSRLNRRIKELVE